MRLQWEKPTGIKLMTRPKKETIDQLVDDLHNHNINSRSREIYLHGYHGSGTEEPGVDYRMATTFVKNLHLLESQGKKNILVHLHTIGGEWSDGMAVFNSIKLAKSPVTILAYAQASSMSGIILQAGDKRVLMPDCEIMIHYGYINMHDNSLAAYSAIKWNEKIKKRMLQILSERAILGEYFRTRNFTTKKAMSFIDSKIKQKSDWYLDSEQAVYYGFADGILGDTNFENIDKIRTVRKLKK